MNVAVTTKASLIPQTNWTLKYIDSYNWYNWVRMPLMETKTHFGIQTGARSSTPHEIRIDLGATYNLSNSATAKARRPNKWND